MMLLGCDVLQYVVMWCHVPKLGGWGVAKNPSPFYKISNFVPCLENFT